MSIGLIPGTFDPPTLGHLDIIKRAAALCKKLIVGVANNQGKRHPCFSSQERVELLKAIISPLNNVEVIQIDGLIIDFAKSHKIDFLIRGLRAFSNMEYEFQMALTNKRLGELETLFLIAEGTVSHISSSLIREVAANGHHLKDFVPESIESQVSARLQEHLTKRMSSNE